MTLPTFSIGDEVLIVGPTITGCKLYAGKRFTITQADSGVFTGNGYPWYLASSLQLVNKASLSPMQVTYNYKPDDYEHGTIQVSYSCGRKAEIAMPAELKIGDWVEVIGSDVALNDYYRGRRFRISQTPCQMSDMFSCEFYPNYFPAKSLRKLTPEEVAKHTAPKLELSQETKVKIGMTLLKQLDQIGEVRDRLTAIEKRQDIQGDRLNTIDLEKDDLRKRLAFVEKFQRDQDDFVGRAIRDGVVEISDFRRKA